MTKNDKFMFSTIKFSNRAGRQTNQIKLSTIICSVSFEKNSNEKQTSVISKALFFNGCFDKNRIKLLVTWSLKNCGESVTIDLIENLKNIGFKYATEAGISLGIDDLQIPLTKNKLLLTADINIKKTQINYQQEFLTGIEKFQHLIDTWHRTSEILKQNVISHFKLTNILNPVYMMAFSGARGNVSQVRQLVGMRGLMSDPQGEIINFPIKSNFREGITLTEYIISCYGARKGLVDTALKTANSGYLTRRLVDVCHHIIVFNFDCNTNRGIILGDLLENKKIIVPLQTRLIGRILSENIYCDNNIKTFNKKFNNQSQDNILPINKFYCFYKKYALFFYLIILYNIKISVTNIEFYFLEKINSTFVDKKQTIETLNIKYIKIFLNFLDDACIYHTNHSLIAIKNQEISRCLALKLCNLKKTVLVRSPLTCEIKNSICQLCYGWSLVYGKLVPLGEAVGVIAGQSIGEPGTQLTMRTFHTGGVFSGDIMSEIIAPFNGKILFFNFLQGTLIRTSHGKICFLTKIAGSFKIETLDDLPLNHENVLNNTFFKIPSLTILFVRNRELVSKTQIIAEFSSMFTDPTQRIQARYDLNAEIDGEVFFKKMLLKIHKQEKKLISRITCDLGSILILSGNICKQPIFINIFSQPGDLVDKSSIVCQYQIISPYQGYFIVNKKLYNTKQTKVLYNKNLQPSFLCPKKENFPVKKNLFLQVLKKPSAKLPLQSGAKNLQHSFFCPKGENFQSSTENLLNFPLLCIFIQCIQYRKIGYFFNFFNIKISNFSLTNLQLNHQHFFISTSLNQKFTNYRTLTKKIFFRSFPKQYQTQTGGIIISDKYYLNEKIYFGEIFWIPKQILLIYNSPQNVNISTFKIFFKKFSPFGQNKLILNKNVRSKKLSTIICFAYLKFLFKLFKINNLKKKNKLGKKKFAAKLRLGYKVNYRITLPILIPLSIFNTQSPTILGIKNFVNKNESIFFYYNSQGKFFNFGCIFNGYMQFYCFSNFIYNQTKYYFGFKINLNNFNNSLKRKNYGLRFKFFHISKNYRLKKKNSNFNYRFHQTSFNVNPGMYIYFFIYNYAKKIVEAALPYGPNLAEKNKINLLTKIRIVMLYPQFPWKYLKKNTKVKIKFKFYFLSNKIRKKTLILNLALCNKNYLLNSICIKTKFDYEREIIITKKAVCQNSAKNTKKLPHYFVKSFTTHLKNTHQKANSLMYELTKSAPRAIKKPVKKVSQKSIKNKVFLNQSFTGLSKNLNRIKIKPGWVYIPHNCKQNIKKHNHIINPGKTAVQPILFDQYPIYCLSITIQQIFIQKKKYLIKKIYNLTTQTHLANFQLRFSEADLPPSGKESGATNFYKKFNKKIYCENKEIQKNFLQPELVENLQKFIFNQNNVIFYNSNFFGKKIFKHWFLLKKWCSLFFYKNATIVSIYNTKKVKKNKLYVIYEIFLLKKNLYSIFYTTTKTNILQKMYFLKNTNFDTCTNLVFIFNKKNIIKSKNILIVKKRPTGSFCMLGIQKQPGHKKQNFLGLDEVSLKNTLSLEANTNFSTKNLRQSCKKKSKIFLKAAKFFKISIFCSNKNLSFCLYHVPIFKLNTFTNKCILAQKNSKLYTKKMYLKHKVFNISNILCLKKNSLYKKLFLVIHKVDSFSFYNVYKYKKLISNQNIDFGVSDTKNWYKLKIPQSFFSYKHLLVNKIQKNFTTPTLNLNLSDTKTITKKNFSLNNNQLLPVCFTQITLPLNFAKLQSNNKQHITNMFWQSSSPDFHIKYYFKHQFYNEIEFLQKIHIFEYYINFNIPNHYRYNHRIQIVFCSKQTHFMYNKKFFSKASKDFESFGSKQSFAAKSIFYDTQMYLNIFILIKLHFPINTHLDAQTLISLNSKKKIIFSKKKYVTTQTSIINTNLLALYSGEILNTGFYKKKNTTHLDFVSNPQTNQNYLILTDQNKIQFFINTSKNEFNKIHKTISFFPCSQLLFLGKNIRYGSKIHGLKKKSSHNFSKLVTNENLAIPAYGIIIQIEKSKIIIRKAQPILFSPRGLVAVYPGDIIEKNTLVLSLFYQRLKTGDIVQGIPRIEQLFEARQTSQGELLPGSLHQQTEEIFSYYIQKYNCIQAAKYSLEKIQQIIVNNVKKVYKAQGVMISDKHLEIIIRQMTSKVEIIESGGTHLLPGELVDLDWIELVNETLEKNKAQYVPKILGITRKSLQTKSFLSEASFQETTRVLATSTIQRRTDFLKGLKENVILGKLVPAGTGFDSNIPVFKRYEIESYESYSIFRDIFLKKIK